MRIKKEVLFDYSKKSKKFFDKHIEIRDTFEFNIVSYISEGKQSIDIKNLKENNFYYLMRIGKYI